MKSRAWKMRLPVLEDVNATGNDAENLKPADVVELDGRNIVVVGCGRTGMSVAEFCARRGARVTVTDAADPAALAEAAAGLSALGIGVEFGGHRTETLVRADLIVVSPGVPHVIEPLAAARAAGVPVMGEIELAFHFIDAPIAAVTGTNGKSTVTLLLGEMLKASGTKVFVGGNIGTPLIEYCNREETADWIVAEISSFQLDTIAGFRPKISVLLNITDDHLDRYADAGAYARSKGRIFMNQRGDDTAVVNMGDPTVRREFERHCDAVAHDPPKGFVYGLGTNQRIIGERADALAWITDDAVWFDAHEAGRFRVFRADIRLMGRHNLENVCAAGLAAVAAGASPEGVATALKNFTGLAHRIQYVDTVNGIVFVDDSKATNVDAVARALEAFDGPVVLIMGGRDKGGAYLPLKNRFAGRVRHLVVMGEAADAIAAALGDAAPVTKSGTMDHAVWSGAAAARPGDTVLLSPACSSFDMYESYAQRGNDFSRVVGELKRGLA
jgi:UDP-N-acetylmuramoylalanine--D-glutamate ligase